ncbi:hypothetical protein IWQ61_008427 [Dispira simplex]|nr:hypothetical protein IWQ61_008427 [Dispira simplex]
MNEYSQRSNLGRTQPWLIGAAVSGVMVLASIGFFIAAAVLRSKSGNKANGMPAGLPRNIALNTVGAILIAAGLCGLLWCALRLNRIYAIREKMLRADQAVQNIFPPGNKDGVVVFNEEMYVSDVRAQASTYV